MKGNSSLLAPTKSEDDGSANLGSVNWHADGSLSTTRKKLSIAMTLIKLRRNLVSGSAPHQSRVSGDAISVVGAVWGSGIISDLSVVESVAKKRPRV